MAESTVVVVVVDMTQPKMKEKTTTFDSFFFVSENHSPKTLS